MAVQWTLIIHPHAQKIVNLHIFQQNRDAVITVFHIRNACVNILGV